TPILLRRIPMRLSRWTIALGVATFAAAGPHAAQAADAVVIGDIDDMSGVYADVEGAAGAEVINMAGAGVGGTVLGRKITVLSADHQNKPDIGASKFREWADQQGLNLLLGGSNTGVNIAMAKVAAAKKVPFIVIGAGGASLTNEDCTAYSVHYVYDTTALANGTATAMVNAGNKTWYYLTADYAFGTQLQTAASKVVETHGGKNLGAVRVPLGGFLLLPAASAVLRRAGTRTRERRHGLQQLAQSGQRVRHHSHDEASGAPRLHHRHPQSGADDRPGAVPDYWMVLGPQRRD